MTSDVVAVIKWIHANADELGVDANKICLNGCSGGGFAAQATCSKLAIANESHLVKLACLVTFVEPHYWLVTKKEDMPFREVKDGFYDAPFVAHAYATDYEK